MMWIIFRFPKTNSRICGSFCMGNVGYMFGLGTCLPHDSHGDLW